MTPRSLVGMTMGARKRAWLAGRIDAIVFPDGINTDELEMKSAYSWSEIRRWWQPFGWQILGQRLRPCPGCPSCTDSPRLQVMGYARRIGGSVKMSRIYVHWRQRSEYSLSIDCTGSVIVAGGVTKDEAWNAMRGYMREQNQLDATCNGSGVLPAKKAKVKR